MDLMPCQLLDRRNEAKKKKTSFEGRGLSHSISEEWKSTKDHQYYRNRLVRIVGPAINHDVSLPRTTNMQIQLRNFYL